MRQISIGKATYDISQYDNRHVLDSKWSNPPNFDKIKKAKDLFKNKKHNNYEKIYTILIARSNELRGDTKVSNELLARQLGISTRQVIRSIQYLEKNGVISSIKKCYKFGSKYKTVRIIRVWVTYYKHKCRPLYDNVFKTDIRPGKEWEEKIARKIPLKFRVWKGFVPKKPCKKKKDFVYLKAADYSWTNLLMQGYINHEMSIIITQLETLGSDNETRKKLYPIIGYNRDFLIFKNTGIKKSQKFKKDLTVKKEINTIKEKIDDIKKNMDFWGEENELVPN